MPVIEPDFITDEFVQDVLDYLSEPTDGLVDEFDRMRAALLYAANDGERAGEV